MSSIQTKMTVTILTIFLISLAALGGLNYWKARTIVTESITKDMVNQANTTSRDVGDWLATRKAELALIAGNPVVVSGSMEGMIPVLAAAKNSSKSFETVVYAGLDGNSVNGEGFKVSVADRPFFKAAINGQPFVSDPLISRASGNLTVIIAVPVKAGDKVIGVIFGPTVFKTLSNKVLSVKAGKTGYAFVTQRDGLKIIHPNKELAMKDNSLTNPKASPDMRKLAERMSKGETGIVLNNVLGKYRYTAFAPVPGTSWSLAISVPKQEVSEAISSLTIVSLVTIVVVMIIAGLIIAGIPAALQDPSRCLQRLPNGLPTAILPKRN